MKLILILAVVLAATACTSSTSQDRYFGKLTQVMKEQNK